MCARPLKDISSLSSERLRKIDPYELERRRQEEEKRETKKKEAIKVKHKISKSLKIYFKNINLYESGEVSLKTLEILEPLVSELIFIEKMLEQIKRKLLKDGLFSELNETNVAMKEYKDIVKIKTNLVDKINNHLSKLEINKSNNDNDDFNINDIDISKLIEEIK